MKSSIVLKALVSGAALLCAGVMLSACSDAKFEVSVPCQHQTALDVGSSATCTENGLTSGTHCILCNEIIAPQELIPATGHRFADPDCTTPMTCTVCGATEGLPNGHSWQEATCLTPKTCTTCNATEGTAGSHYYTDGICVYCYQRKPSEGLVYNLNADGESYSVTGIGSCTDTVLVIPAEHDGKPVTGIAASAFTTLPLTHVYLPQGLVQIGSRAFEGCSFLTEISLPQSLISLGSYAFSNCTTLENITLPDGLVSIGSLAFDGCIVLREIVIPESVTTLGSWIFRGCASLRSALFACTVKNLGDSMFENCGALETVILPKGLTTIGSYTFYKCHNLNTITLPDSLTDIGSYAFYDCSALSVIAFNGTTGQWKSITFGKNWNSSTPAYVVACANGTLDK